MLLNEVDRLVVANLPYARSLARRYRRPGLDVDDLEQEAALALVEAAKKFEPEKNPGVPFVAFARPFLVRRLGVIACPEALASLPHDLPAPSDPAAEARQPSCGQRSRSFPIGNRRSSFAGSA